MLKLCKSIVSVAVPPNPSPTVTGCVLGAESVAVTVAVPAASAMLELSMLSVTSGGSDGGVKVTSKVGGVAPSLLKNRRAVFRAPAFFAPKDPTEVVTRRVHPSLDVRDHAGRSPGGCGAFVSDCTCRTGRRYKISARRRPSVRLKGGRNPRRIPRCRSRPQSPRSCYARCALSPISGQTMQGKVVHRETFEWASRHDHAQGRRSNCRACWNVG